MIDARALRATRQLMINDVWMNTRFRASDRDQGRKGKASIRHPDC